MCLYWRVCLYWKKEKMSLKAFLNGKDLFLFFALLPTCWDKSLTDSWWLEKKGRHFPKNTEGVYPNSFQWRPLRWFCATNPNPAGRVCSVAHEAKPACLLSDTISWVGSKSLPVGISNLTELKHSVNVCPDYGYMNHLAMYIVNYPKIRCMAF